MRGSLIPQVPESKPEDPEDVSWALSTAEAMWARGDHADGIKWVRKAAEAASEAEHDSRALELAKAAADLAALLARRSSLPSSELLEDVVPPPVPPAPPTKPGMPAPKVPPAKPSIAPAAPSAAPPSTSVVPPAPSSASMPPRPFSGASPSRAPAPIAARTSVTPAAPKRPVTDKPAAPANEKPAAAKPGAATPLQKAPPGKKGSRRSRENLDAEARMALQATDTTKALPAEDSSPELSETGETVAVMVPHRRRGAGGSDVPGAPSTDQWPDSETTDKGVPSSRPSVVPPRAATSLAKTTTGKAMGVGSSFPARAEARHDPAIVTSQAVRVVVYRDANGVHVAPSGTVVSAISIEAVLVCLEPNADLTAWLSAGDGPKQRR